MLGHRRHAGAALAALSAVATVGLAPPGAAAQAQPGQASRIAGVTGAGSINDTEARYQVKGTDLGIMWTDEREQVLVAFGDTFGAAWAGHGSGLGDPAAIDWRSNTLARSSDRNPVDGLVLDDFRTDRPGHAKELVPSLKRDGVEVSKIPTGGVNVGGRSYMAYMSVRSFTQPGRWITNHSGIAYSDDGGQTWAEALSAFRPNTPASDEKFQMIAYARRDGFVYAFGTPNGRFGDAYVARVPEQQVLDQLAYEYWTGIGWQRGGSVIATPIVPGPVGELSVRYDETLNSWQMMTMDEARGAIVVRLAPQPTGPWGPPIEVATSREYPHLYGGFLHPDSKGSEIYFTMTQYDRYNVSMMYAKLPADAVDSAQAR
ncbi:MAG: DUF4185 domain-containing protein [Actinomycetota bacterium]|nr:DUF4185 domain-containing protein [Actinomycetota bacterium]